MRGESQNDPAHRIAARFRQGESDVHASNCGRAVTWVQLNQIAEYPSPRTVRSVQISRCRNETDIQSRK